MFYQNENKEWTPHTKKITYTKTHIAFDSDESPYLNNDKFQNVIVQDINLTPEQSIRLAIVKSLSTGIQDIEDYVMNGTLNQENISLVKHVENSALQQLILKYIPKEELDNASLTFEPVVNPPLETI